MITLTRKERDRQLRKSDILTAAEHIFALKGFHDATMQDIAKEAQYATGTVYLYFKNKDSLYFSLVDDKMESLLAIIKEEVKKVHDAEDKLRVFINETLAFFEKNQYFFRIFFSERSKSQVVKDSRFYRSSVILRHKEFVVSLIKTGQEQKIIRNDFNPRQIADIFSSIFLTVIFDWLKEEPGDTKSLRDMADFILNIFLSGAERKR